MGCTNNTITVVMSRQVSFLNRVVSCVDFVKEHVSQQESNVKDHTRFVERQHVCREWLLKAQQKLDEACNVDGDNDEDSLNIKLSIVEVNSCLRIQVVSVVLY